MLKKLLILTILCSTSLLAGGDIYTWGYHDMVAESLLGLTMFLEEQDSNLMKIVFSFGLLAMFLSVFKHKTHGMIAFEFTKMMVMLIMIKALFLQASDTSTYRFNVVDRITNQTTTINKVPIAIGETLSLFTAVEDAILKRMEVSFSMPDSNSYRQAGLGFNLAAPMEVFRQKAKNPYLEKSLTAYLEDCKFLGDFQTIQNYNDIFYATDIKAVLAAQNHLLSTHYDPSYPNGQTMDCQDLWSKIEHGVGLDATNTLNQLGKKFGMDDTTFNNKADVAMTTMINSTTNSQGNMEQAILRNTTLESVNKIASSVNIDLTTLARNKGIAEWTMTNDAILSTLQAQGFVPIMKAMVLVIIITISWILAILSIATLNPSYVKMFFTLNLWLLLWGPLFQILNYAIDIITVDELSAYGTITAENQIDIFGALGAKVSILSKLVWAVPMLAFAIAKGSEHAMVSFIGGMGQGASAAVSGALQQQTRDAVMGRTEYLSLQNNAVGKQSEKGVEYKENIQGPNGQYNQSFEGNNLKVENPSTGLNATLGDNRISASSAHVGANATKSLETAASTASKQIEAASYSLASGVTQGNADVKMNGETATVQTKDGRQVAVSKQDAEAYQNVKQVSQAEGYNAAMQTASSEQLQKVQSALTDLGVTRNLGIEGTSGGKTPSFLPVEASLIAKAGISVSSNDKGALTFTNTDGVSKTVSVGSETSEAFTKTSSETASSMIAKNESVALAVDRVIGASEGESQTQTDQSQKSIQDTYQYAYSTEKALSEVSKNGKSASSDLYNSAMNKYLEEESKKVQEKGGRGLFDSQGNFIDLFAKEEAAAMIINKDADLQRNPSGLGAFLANGLENVNKNIFEAQVSSIDAVEVPLGLGAVNGASDYVSNGTTKDAGKGIHGSDLKVPDPQNIKTPNGAERSEVLDAYNFEGMADRRDQVVDANMAKYKDERNEVKANMDNNLLLKGAEGINSIENAGKEIFGTTYDALNQDYGPPGGSGNTKTYGPQVSSPLLKKD